MDHYKLYCDSSKSEMDSITNTRLSRFPVEKKNVWHFHPIAFVEQMQRISKMKDIDITDPDKWISQFDISGKACFTTCQLIVKKYNVISDKGVGHRTKKYANGTPYFSGAIQVAIQMKDGSLQSTGREQEGIDYIDQQLDAGYPVVIGVDDGRRTTYNSDHSTEHFLVITGRLTDDKGLYYRFLEVGTGTNNREKRGYTPKNRLYVTNNNMIQGKKFPDRKKFNKTYTVVQIRKNKPL
ncbi:hypothetical protein OAT16_07805 [Prolixibacteraceae bacterium]|nr:hypothetical protein [Prolixibacteraceae bacterium]